MNPDNTSETIKLVDHTIDIFNTHGLLGLIVLMLFVSIFTLTAFIVWRITYKQKTGLFEQSLDVIGKQSQSLMESLTESVRGEIDILNQNIKAVHKTSIELNETIKGNVLRRVNSLENISNDLARRVSQVEGLMQKEGHVLKNTGPAKYIKKKPEESVWSRDQV